MVQNIYDNETFFEGYKNIRSKQYNYNNLFEQPQFLSMLPALENKRVLDIGCGYGDFAAFCINQGAQYVTGLDVSSNMISHAQASHQHKNLTFKNEAIETVTLAPQSYDLVCSSLALHYVQDFKLAICKISEALNENGVLVFSCHHPLISATIAEDEWLRDEQNIPQYFKLNAYHHEGKRNLNWIVDEVVVYHRKLSTIINTLIECGLQIEQIAEPEPSDEAILKMPSIKKEKERPVFLFVRARKQNY